MSNRLIAALRVNELAKSIAFYENIIGFELIDYLPTSDIAKILDSDGYPLLLAGPNAENVISYVDEPRWMINAGEPRLNFLDKDLDTRYAMLTKQDIIDVKLEELPSGDRKLYVHDPDGYTLTFFTPIQRPFEELKAYYLHGLEELASVLTGLSEQDLNLAQNSESWSIRQIIHHLAEGDSLIMTQIKMALAESGCTYVRVPYGQDVIWLKTLDYAGREIDPSLNLMKAIRLHILQLLDHFPNSWEHYVLVKESEESIEHMMTVGEMIDMLVRHVTEHIEEINKIRQVNGL